ncbi:MAG: MFS transporter [Candidatus Hodarchaeales archaeon]|jgi:MFS family permease
MTSINDSEPTPLGIRANLDQFIVQLLLVFFVGIIIGLERITIPKVAEQEFGISSFTVIMTFVISFGVVKSLLNLYGGYISEKYGRKPVLIVGWLIAIPIPILIIIAKDWWIIVFANLLLGVNQGLAWSMTVTSKIDISGKEWRGFAVGLNEWAGYGGVALATLIAGFLITQFNSLRTVPFMFGLVIVVLANIVAIFFSKETIHFAKKESRKINGREKIDFVDIFKKTSITNKTLFATSQAGLIEKFVDVVVWVGFPVYFSTINLPIDQLGIIVAVYGFSWGFLQLLTGVLSDQIGRKPLIFGGMVLSGIGVSAVIIVEGLFMWIVVSTIIGMGMAMLYPTLLAVVGDVAEPAWRATSLGVYRMWRDAGYAIGAFLIGIVMDMINIEFGFFFTTGMMLISAFIVLIFMDESIPTRKIN